MRSQRRAFSRLSTSPKTAHRQGQHALLLYRPPEDEVPRHHQMNARRSLCARRVCSVSAHNLLVPRPSDRPYLAAEALVPHTQKLQVSFSTMAWARPRGKPPFRAEEQCASHHSRSRESLSRYPLIYRSNCAANPFSLWANSVRQDRLSADL